MQHYDYVRPLRSGIHIRISDSLLGRICWKRLFDHWRIHAGNIRFVMDDY